MKRTTTNFRALFILTISILLLLITGGNVKANDQYWEGETDGLSGINWWQDQVGEIYRGENYGIKWEATITQTNNIGGQVGKVSFKIINPKEISGDIELPDYIQGKGFLVSKYLYEIDTIEQNAFYGAEKVTKISLGQCVSTIESNAFTNCKSLEEVVVSKNLKEWYVSLDGTSSLKRIIVDENNPYFSSDDEGVLYNKDKTKLITFPKGKQIEEYTIPNTVNIIGLCSFRGVENLKKVNIHENVTSIEYDAFSSCLNIEEINFLGNSKLEKIGASTFSSCKKIKRINIPDSVQEIESGVFSYCTNLEEVKLPCNLKKISLALFNGCTNLKNIELPRNLEEIDRSAFSGAGIIHIEIPKGVKSIGQEAFIGCNNLLTVVLSNSVESIGKNAFKDCNSNLVVYCYNCDESFIEKINANGTAIPAYILCEGIDEDYPQNNIIDYVRINKFVEGPCREIELLSHIYGLPVKVLGEAAFKGNNNIQKIKIPATVTTMQDEVFCGCTSLNNVVLPKTIKNIPSRAFYKCDSLSKVVIKKGSEIKSIGENVFDGASANLIVYHDGENSVVNEYGKNLNTFKIDNEAPSATIDIRDNANKLNSTIKLLNIDDKDGSGAEFFAISLSSNVEDVKDYEWKEVEQNTVTVDINENSTWYVYLMDMVGNVKSKKKDITGLDENAPTFLSEPQIEYNLSGAIITATVVDEEGGSGLDSYAITNSADTESISNWIELNENPAEIKDLVTSNGIWYLHIKDNAENIITKPVEVTQIDNKRPQVNDIDTTYRDIDAIIKINVTDDKILQSYAIDFNQNTSETTKWIDIDGEVSAYDIDYIAETNGTYYVHVKDKYGNINDVELDKAYFTIENLTDKIAPRIEFVGKTNNVINVKITDAFSGIAEGAKISYVWGESKDTAPETDKDIQLSYNAGDKEVIFEVPCEGQGTYYLWLNIEELKDIEGNTNTQGKIYSDSYTFDVEAPTITSVTTNKSTIKNGETVIFTITTSENVTKADSILPRVEQNEQVQCELGELTGEGTTWELTLTAGTGDGTVTVNIPEGIFKDNIGNALSEGIKEIITIDNTSPVLSNDITEVTISDSIISQGQESTFTFTAKEELKINHSKGNDVTLTNGEISGFIKDIKLLEDNKTCEITVIGGAGDGDVNLKLPTGLFVDYAGNEAQEVVYKGLKFDNTAPEIEIMNPNNTVVNLEDTVVYIVKSTERINKNEGTIELKNVNDGDTISAIVNDAKVDEEGKEWEVTLTNCTGDGEARLLIPAGYFIDEAGNTNTVKEKTGLRVDNTAVEIGEVSEPTLDETKEKAIVEIQLPENEQKLQYVVSKSETIEGITEEWKDVTTNPLKIEITEPGTYYVYIKDEAGNIRRTDEIEIPDIMLDKVSPTVKVDYEDIDNQVKVIITANERIQVIEGWSYADDSETIIEKIFTEDTNTTIQLKDLAGNVSEVSISVEITKEEGFFVRLIDTSEYEMVEEGEKLYIENIAPKTTIETVIGNIVTNGHIKIYKGETEVTEEEIKDGTKVGTGMTIKVSKGTEIKEYTVVVKGDATGDGEANFSDILQINKHRLNKIKLEAAYEKAGDVTKDKKVDFKDILQINKYRLGKIDTI